MNRIRLYQLLGLVISFGAVGAGLLYLLSLETARGDVVGKAIAEELGTPLPGADIDLNMVGGTLQHFATEADDHGRFEFRRIPAGEYRIAAHSIAHKLKPQRITVTEGRGDPPRTLELSPVEPFLDLYMHQSVFTPSEKPELRCRGFGPAASAELEVYRVDFATAVAARHRGLTRVLSPHGGSIESLDLRQVPQLELIAEEEQSITTRDLEGVFNERIRLPQLSPGIYLVGVSIDELRRVEMLTITDMGIIVKSTREQVLVFAVELESGRPYPDVEVNFTWGGKPIGSGRTDDQGLLEMALPRERGDGSLDINAHSGGSFAFVDTWRWYSPDHDGWRVYTYTDRPAYRPGQTVYFKSIARKRLGNEYQVPADVEATVRIHDGRDNLVYSGRHTTNEYGSLHGELELPENALPGLYNIALRLEGETVSSDFEVLEYRKPEFEVQVKTDQGRYTRGDTIRATVRAEYYYGAPVADAEVSYEVTRSEYWFFPGEQEWDVELYEPYTYSGDGGIVLSGLGRTNSAGEFVLQIPTEVATDEDIERPVYDQRYTISAEVVDPSRRWVSGSRSMIVTQGEYFLEVQCSPSVLAPDDPTTVKITACDYDGKPVADASGYVKLERLEWVGSVEQSKQEASDRWTTDAQGTAEVALTPTRKAGYRVLAVSEDSRGNKIRAQDQIWVTDGRYASFSYPYGELALTTDKTVYQVGDVAQILVNTNYAPTTALLTVEGADIYRKELVELAGKSTILDVAVRDEYLPGCYVSVAFVRDKRFFSEQVPLTISRRAKAVQVAITPDHEEYLPSAPARYLVRTTDGEGNPVRAEVSLAVVDEAVHALAPDRAGDILRRFYPHQDLAVETHFSFPEIYLSGGDKAGRHIATRKKFRDTAFWAPSIVTDRNGQASFAFDMPDNLTTWRATVRASTLDSRFGQGVNKVVCSKPFLVRLGGPRFFTQKDEVVISNLVHNRTDQPLTVTAGLDVPELEFSGKSDRSARVGPGDIHRFEWHTSVPTAGEKQVRVWAEAGDLSDAMELTLPVVPKGRRRVETRVGSVEDKQIERLQIREDAIAGATAMQIRLTPSLASGMLGSLEYLAGYPYGCTEQTMSAFLPDVAIAQTLKKLKISAPYLEAELPEMVQAGLLKLYDYQHSEGGWGWWRYDEDDPWMTAYVLFGLVQARDAGFPVNERVISRGLRVMTRMSKKDIGKDNLAFVAYVFGLVGNTEQASSLLDGLITKPRRGGSDVSSLDNWSQAMVALTLHGLDRSREARSVLAALRDRAEVGKNLVYWKASGKWSDIEATAMALKAACAVTPRDHRLPNVVRWLMLQRQGGHWQSTRDTAFVLYALADYLAVTGELAADLAVVVELNGEQLAVRRFTSRDVFKPELVIDAPAELLEEQEQTLSLAASGTGRLYYTAELSQYVPAELETETITGHGLVVQRTYRKLNAGAQAVPQVGEPLAVRSGEVIEVTLKLSAEREFEYLMLEDPIPAGCEVPDQGRVSIWEWDYWWADRVVRDELVAFAITRLPKGTKEIKYKLVAQIPGEYCAMPTQVYNMYDPRVRTAGTVASIAIKP